MIRTPKYELQMDKVGGGVVITGVNSIKEAKQEITFYVIERPDLYNLTGKFFLWGNSAAGKSYLKSQDVDYLTMDYSAGQIVTEACAIPF